ncbi:Bacteroides conjugative transposon TraM protein [Segatella baroniae B14]|nr:Bacteroides conjugative transposon TraM protein [Segatella baroniae B14]
MTMNKFKNINFKQGKYILPLFIYFPSLFVGYFVIDLFHTEKAEIPDKNLTTTEYLNPELPEAKMRGDGIGGKYESMVKSYGKIDDYSAMENIDRNEETQKEEYESKYTDSDLEMLAQLQESKEKGEAMANHELSKGNTEEERLAQQHQREREAMEELNKALEQARLHGKQSTQQHPNEVTEKFSDHVDESQTNQANKAEGKVNINENAVRGLSNEEKPQEVVKKVKVTSDYFNTIAVNEPEAKLIKAIIDEDVKAVDGSRIRLRLLDDIEINQTTIPKGSYLYATMSGFSSQRVKGSIKSILVNDELIKVSLSLYDTDGLEGLYVPGSNFRETTKDVASGAMNNTSSLTQSSTTPGNALVQWGNQAITNAVQKTSNAVSKSIRKNSAKLKYGTFVYLINGKEKKQD